jgi:hypothetical protein
MGHNVKLHIGRIFLILLNLYAYTLSICEPDNDTIISKYVAHIVERQVCWEYTLYDCALLHSLNIAGRV